MSEIRQGTQPVRTVPPSDKKGSSAGCWVGAFFTLIVVFGLVIFAVFLPPFNLYDRIFEQSYTILDSNNNAVIVDGLTFALNPSDVGTDFGVQLTSVSLEDFETRNAEAGEWIPEVRSALPTRLAIQSPVYQIETTGIAPNTATFSLTVDNELVLNDLLDLYGWYTAENTWQFIPSRISNDHVVTTIENLPEYLAVFQSNTPSPTVLAAYNVTENLSNDVAQLATIVSPAGLQPALDGTLDGNLAPGFDINAGYLVMPSIRNYSDPRAIDPNSVITILENPNLRQEHIRQIMAASSSSGYDGVFIDYREIPEEQGENFVQLIQELNSGMKSLGLLVGVVVPAAENIDGIWDTGAYDWRSLGQIVDYFQINMKTNPTTFTPGDNQFADALLRWTVGEVERSKILLGLSARSIREIAGEFTLIGYDEAIASLGNVAIDAPFSETGSVPPGAELRASLDGLDAVSGINSEINTPYMEFLGDDMSVQTRVWLTTRDALRFRMDKTIPFTLAGVAFEDLLADDLADNALDAIINYKAQIPRAPAPNDLALRWTIEGVDGQIDEVMTNLNEELIVTLTAPDGNYAVNVAVIGVGQEEETLRNGAAVALFRPTITPTPLPTATPTPVPTATPTLAPIIPTNPPAPAVAGNSIAAAPQNTGPSGGGQSAIRPGAGSISLSGFEYGAHVTGSGSARAINALRQSGGTWMKVQIRYGPGAGFDGPASEINVAKANGFKILLGIVGYPNDLANGGEDYIQGFSSWAATVAGLGADAIEIWNEPNLAREWPEGQISGGNYTNLLRQVSSAIKATSPGTIVISGALAPTGAEAAFPGQVVNDDRFLREMVASGALDYVDCVGVHYNEGIVPPSARGGDPRDNYYTRYFGTMIDTYWSITGGRKPLCFTELGYLTSEGFGPLPSFFSWAQNVTLAQQAAWLAEAAAISSRSGRVRIMIIWNADFEFYGEDPMAGFAIMRPNGTCPACAALAGAR